MIQAKIVEILQAISSASISMKAAKQFLAEGGQDNSQTAHEYVGEAINALKRALNESLDMSSQRAMNGELRIFVDYQPMNARNVRIAFDQGQTDEEITDFLEISNMSDHRKDTPRKLWIESRGEIMVESMEHRKDGSLKITMDK